MVFDYDKKQIGFYVKEGKSKIKNNNNKINNIIIIFIILILTPLVYKFFFRKNTRKIKANELEDNYEYKSEKENYSKLIN
jgi:flagellar biosynthesis/type III secretory pathway M-ring protein FliF/YscJ